MGSSSHLRLGAACGTAGREALQCPVWWPLTLGPWWHSRNISPSPICCQKVLAQEGERKHTLDRALHPGWVLTWGWVHELLWVVAEQSILDVATAHTAGPCREGGMDAGAGLREACRRCWGPSAVLGPSPCPALVPPGTHHTQPLHCRGCLGQDLPMSTRVFLLKAGSLTTSSYETTSSWSKTGVEEKDEDSEWSEPAQLQEQQHRARV